MKLKLLLQNSKQRIVLMNDSAATIDLNQTSELISGLLQRQDEVLDQLEQLNEKIESMLNSLVGKQDTTG